MSFFTALSGLNAAQTDISVTSNNIANVGTLGFRGSRAEFADIYSSSPQSRPESQVGAGTRVARLGVDFNQGSVTATGNVFDLSLQGPGFFQVRTGPDAGADFGYTRAGAFGMDSEGFVTNAAGQYLTGFATAANGDPLSTTETQRLRIPQEFGEPNATSRIDMGVNISLSDNGGLGTQASLQPGDFDPADASTYAFSTEIPVLDDAGTAVPGRAFFVMTDAPDAADGGLSYEMRLVVNDEIAQPAADAPVLSFDADGLQTGGDTPSQFTVGGRTLDVNLAGSGVTSDAFGVRAISHDGSRRLDLSAVEVRDDGTVWASYGADREVAVGQVAVANFTDLQALGNIGDATYLASRDSGPARLGTPGSSGFGAVRSGAVERANVDLTEELVNLIMAQRNYQASAKALETNGKMSETVMNIRT